MKLADLNGKKVCILGYGREGKAMFNAIEEHAPNAHVTVADENRDSMNELVEKLDNEVPFKLQRGFNMQSGNYWNQNLDQFDVIIKSPGIPPSAIPSYDIQDTTYTTSTQIFLDTIADRGATTIGVTGTKGKSTTASLIYSILKAAKKDALLLGNIGEPAIAHINDVKKGTILVMELSSYQLMNLTSSPHIAVVTSFFPDHLDYHGSLDAYMNAKKNITQFQSADDAVFFHAHNPKAAEIAKEGKGRKIPFSADDAPVSIEETKLIGTHNLSNIAAALAVADELGIPEHTALESVKEFNGLPHRLEFIGTVAKISWVDDAISTTPESTIAAINALDDRVSTIILGGLDRGYDFSQLATCIEQSSIKHVILFPGSGPRIRQALENAGADVSFYDAHDMETAFTTAKKHADPDTIVLLSTASPSYGMFKNYEDKGDQLKTIITNLVN